MRRSRFALRTVVTQVVKILGIAVLALWSLGPIYWSLATSLSLPRDITVRPPNFIPPDLTFRHYGNLLGIDAFMEPGDTSVWGLFKAATLNSVTISLVSTVVVVILAVLAGYAFTRMEFPGRDLLFSAIVGTMAIPAYTVMIPLYRIMVETGLIDTVTGVSLIYVTAFVPLAVWLARAYFAALPAALEEAARIDGASRLQTLVRVLLPPVMPGLFAIAILTFLSSWNQFIIPLVFAPSETRPLTVLVTTFVTKNTVQFGLMSAASVTTMIIPILIVVFLNRYLISGLTDGAIKG